MFRFHLKSVPRQKTPQFLKGSDSFSNLRRHPLKAQKRKVQQNIPSAGKQC